MEKRALKAEKQRDDALDKVKELQHQFYETAVRLEEEQGKNLKLRASSLCFSAFRARFSISWSSCFVFFCIFSNSRSISSSTWNQ